MSSSLTPKQELELDQLKIHLGYLKDLLIAKSASIPTLASLSVGVLVIATLNPRLVSIAIEMKIAVTILLALIPISLLFYVVEILVGIKSAQRSIEDIAGKEGLYPLKGTLRKVWDLLVYLFPLFETIVIGVIIGWYIIFVLWEASL